MSKKRTYRSERVQKVDVAALLPLLAAGCIVALDAAKTKFVVALATLAGEVVKLFRFDHPVETGDFLRVVEALKVGVPGSNIVAALEPTGTYGDAVRHQLVELGVRVEMVAPKRTHDSKELFDGVPSLHDPKSATLIAKLCSLKLGSPWIAPSTTRVRLRALIDQRRYEYQHADVCYGRLEALLSRHWPEFGCWMDVRNQKSALVLLKRLPSPSHVARAAEETRETLRVASSGRIAKELVDGLISTAATTTGVPMVAEEARLVSRLAGDIRDAKSAMTELEEEMSELVKDDEGFARLAPWMGTYTAAVLVTMCDPRQYEKARQLEKACGLNLREKSSGNEKNKGLHITKRGPAIVRQTLYLFTLRMIERDAIVRAWYKRRRGYTEDAKQRAVIAVMRKLVRALFHVARGSDFDATKLFDTRRLVIETPVEQVIPKRIALRTTPRKSAGERSRSAASPRAST